MRKSVKTWGGIDVAALVSSGIEPVNRGPGGAVVYCHNKTGWSGSGIALSYPAWATWGTSACATLSQPPPPGTYPTSIEWFNGAFPIGVDAGKPRQGGVGQGEIVGMYRPDGVSDGTNTIQGVRTADPTSGQWTTPDSMGGSIDEPATQKSYVWNSNNPMQYQDFSGALSMMMLPEPDWIGMIDQCCGLVASPQLQQKAPPLKEIAHVTSLLAARPHPASSPMPQPVPTSPPVCKIVQGLYVCQGADYKWAPLPNVTGAGKHMNCFVPGFLEGAGVAGVVGGISRASFRSITGMDITRSAFDLTPEGAVVAGASGYAVGVYQVYRGC